MKDLLDAQTKYKLEIEQLSHLRLMLGRMREAANKVCAHVKVLQSESKKAKYCQ